MSEQRDFVDFQNGGDTGQDNLDSVQPYLDGEGASQVVFRRPPENVRSRTEILRQELKELKYYRDYGHLMLGYSAASTVAWGGATDDSGTGIVTANGSFRITPFLAPKAGIKATLVNGTPASNEITYTVTGTAYATDGVNAITIEHRDVTSVTHSASITTGPVKRIIVLFDSANSAHTAAATASLVSSAIAGDTASDPDYGITGKLTATATDTGAAIDVLAETRLEGTADAELHIVPGSTLQTFTTSNPLAKGEGVAIWYRNVIEPAGGDPADPKGGSAGGRAESTVGRANTTIPIGSLFKVSAAASAYKIPGAIPICRVSDSGQLIFFDGTRVQKAETITFDSATSVASAALTAHINVLAGIGGAGIVGYDGSGNWADGAQAIASGVTVEAAIDEIVSDLAATTTPSGALHVGVDAAASGLFSGALTAIGGGGALATNTTLRAVLDSLDSNVVARRGFTAVCTDGTLSTGGDFNDPDVIPLINGLGTGTYLLRRGAYTATQGLSGTTGYSIIGEQPGTVTLNNTGGGISFTPTDVYGGFTFENIYFTATTSNTYGVGRGKVNIKDCRAQAGALEFFLGSAFPTRVSIDGLLIDTDNTLQQDNSLFISSSLAGGEVTGLIKNLKITTVNSYNNAVAQKHALRIYNFGVAGTHTTSALVFDDCIIDPSTNYGTGNGAVLDIENSYQPVIFRGCLFRCSQAAADVFIARLMNCTSVTFEDCKFVQDGIGRVLSIAGVASNIKFRKCEFYTSTLAVLSEDIMAYCTPYSGTVPAKSISFEDCYVEIRRGDGTVLERIALNRQGGGDIGTGPIDIDGLHVVLNYTNSTLMNDNLFIITTGTNAMRPAGKVNDLTFDFNLKRLGQANAHAVTLKSAGNFLYATDVKAQNVAEPDTSASATDNTASLFYLFNASISGGTVTGTAQGSNVAGWSGIYTLDGTASHVERTHVWANDSANKGRIFNIIGARAKVLNNNVKIANMAALETADGWFCRAETRRCVITGNTVSVSGTTGSLSAANVEDALIYLTSAAISCIVSGNTMFTPGVLTGIGILGSACSVTGNVIECNAGATVTAIHLISGVTNTAIYGNALRNVDGGFLAIIDDTTPVGTLTVADNVSV